MQAQTNLLSLKNAPSGELEVGRQKATPSVRGTEGVRRDAIANQQWEGLLPDGKRYGYADRLRTDQRALDVQHPGISKMLGYGRISAPAQKGRNVQVFFVKRTDRERLRLIGSRSARPGRRNAGFRWLLRICRGRSVPRLLATTDAPPEQ